MSTDAAERLREAVTAGLIEGLGDDSIQPMLESQSDWAVVVIRAIVTELGITREMVEAMHPNVSPVSARVEATGRARRVLATLLDAAEGTS